MFFVRPPRSKLALAPRARLLFSLPGPLRFHRRSCTLLSITHLSSQSGNHKTIGNCRPISSTLIRHFGHCSAALSVWSHLNSKQQIKNYTAYFTNDISLIINRVALINESGDKSRVERPEDTTPLLGPTCRLPGK
jgi:hypothetical protein